jgi:hypothetical protein
LCRYPEQPGCVNHAAGPHRLGSEPDPQCQRSLLPGVACRPRLGSGDPSVPHVPEHSPCKGPSPFLPYPRLSFWRSCSTTHFPTHSPHNFYAFQYISPPFPHISHHCPCKPSPPSVLPSPVRLDILQYHMFPNTIPVRAFPPFFPTVSCCSGDPAVPHISPHVSTISPHISTHFPHIFAHISLHFPWKASSPSFPTLSCPFGEFAVPHISAHVPHIAHTFPHII